MNSSSTNNTADNTRSRWLNRTVLGIGLVEEEHHGMAFGVLATVNGVGDFLSSVVVGVLWTAFGTVVAFGYSAALFLAGALLIFMLRPVAGRPTVAQTNA